MTNKLPDYINCKSKTNTHCDYFMHEDCKETCKHAYDVKGQNCGAIDTVTVLRLDDLYNGGLTL